MQEAEANTETGLDTSAGEAHTGHAQQCLLATIADELYALDLLAIREVLRSAEKETAPGAPEFVAGLINLRGDIVTVIDAACLLGVRQHRDRDTEPRIIVVEGSDEVVGVQVDSLREVIDYDPEMVHMPQVSNRSAGYQYINGVFTNANDELVILLNVEALCTDQSSSAPG